MVAVEPVAVFISRSSVWVAVLAVADDTVAIVSEAIWAPYGDVGTSQRRSGDVRTWGHVGKIGPR